MTADVSSEHFHGENIQKGGQGTALTHSTRRLERARSTGVTNDNDGAVNVSVKKPGPLDKVVTRAHFSKGGEKERPVNTVESLLLIQRKESYWQVVLIASSTTSRKNATFSPI